MALYGHIKSKVLELLAEVQQDLAEHGDEPVPNANELLYKLTDSMRILVTALPDAGTPTQLKPGEVSHSPGVQEFLKMRRGALWRNYAGQHVALHIADKEPLVVAAHCILQFCRVEAEDRMKLPVAELEYAFIPLEE
jgi:hypothetical protein